MTPTEEATLRNLRLMWAGARHTKVQMSRILPGLNMPRAEGRAVLESLREKGYITFLPRMADPVLRLVA